MIDSFPEPGSPLGAAWDVLADQLGGGPFCRPGWVQAWADAFGGDLVLATAFDDAARLSGVLPLVLRRRGYATPTNDHSCLFGSLAADSTTARELLRSALGSSPWLELTLPANDPVAEAIGVFVAQGHIRCTRTIVSDARHIATTGTFAAYAAGRFSSKRRSEWRRRERRLRELGEVTIEIDETVDGPGDPLDTVFRLEASGWKGERGTAITSSPQTEQFYRAVAAWAAEAGWLRVPMVRIDGVAVAADLALECAGVHYLIKGGYDETLRRFGPRNHLRLTMIERAFTESLSRYELLGTADGTANEWKHGWTDDGVHLVRFEITPASAAGAAVRAGRSSKRRAAEAVRRLGRRALSADHRRLLQRRLHRIRRRVRPR